MDNSIMTITFFSHHFSVSRLTPRARLACTQFAYKQVQWGWVFEQGKNKRKPVKVFAASTEYKEEFRFHINVLKDFKIHLNFNQITDNLITYKTEPYYEPLSVALPLRAKWVLRDYQIPIKEHLVNPIYYRDKVLRSKLVGIQTGRGKGITSMASLSEIGQRFVVIIKPVYIEKWVEELNAVFDISPSDIVIVRGSAQLITLLKQAKENKLTAKCIIISNVTYQGWMKLYEQYTTETLRMGYSCLPIDFYKLLRVGVRVIDELHQSFHNSFKIDLYTHVPLSISLSATLLSDDPFIESMQKVMHPLETRYDGGELIKYIDAFSFHYKFKYAQYIKTKEYGNDNYSHNAFEQSIMRNAITLANYLKLIDYALEISYCKVTRKKKKCIIFAYTTEMCTLIVNHLKKKHPSYDIRRYVSDDPWENLMDPDVIATTLGSAGTAVDVPDLTTVILTNAVSSSQSNIQSLGRLRKLDDCDTQFLFFVCDDIPKHMEYLQTKKTMLASRAKSYHPLYSGHVL